MNAYRSKPTKNPTPGIVLKYFLLQIPGLVVFAAILWGAHQWASLPVFAAWILLVIWVGKDVALFPFLWRYYDSRQIPDRFDMVGRQGRALSDLTPEGYVRINGERWKAVNHNPEPSIRKEDAVRVTAIEGLELAVVPASTTPDEPGA